MSTNKTVNLDGTLYGIRSDSDDDIPALDLEMGTNDKAVLIFTSAEAARKYCYYRCPDREKKVFEFSRRHEDGKVLQVDVIRTARKVKKNYPSITGFVIDHPGMSGHEVSYVSVDDMCVLGMNPEQNKSMTLEGFLDSLMD